MQIIAKGVGHRLGLGRREGMREEGRDASVKKYNMSCPFIIETLMSTCRIYSIVDFRKVKYS